MCVSVCVRVSACVRACVCVCAAVRVRGLRKLVEEADEHRIRIGPARAHVCACVQACVCLCVCVADV